MNLKPRKQKLWRIAAICLPAFLGACATTPQPIPAQCPKFPPLPPELMRPPPTLYLLPDSKTPLPPATN